MNETPIDPRELKATQREAWDEVAAGWRKWWPTFESGGQALSDRLVEIARIRSGDCVLDVATGIGEPALTAARVVGPRGRVIATDLSPQMIALARERARDEGLANVEFREMDAEDLALEPEHFDAALCRWGLMLMSDPAAAASGLRRALKPGGRVAVAVWGAKGKVPFMSLAGDVAQRELAIAPQPEGAPGPLRLGRPGQLETVLEQAGFRSIETHVVSLVMEFPSAAEYVRFLRDLSSTLRRALEAFPAVDQERAWSAIEREAERYRDSPERDRAPGGRLRFVNEVRCATGTH